MKYINKKTIVIAIFSWILLFSTNANAQWKIPASFKNKKAPSETTVDNALSGKAIYSKTCKVCHNTPGVTGAEKPFPDLGRKVFLKSSDGEIFYQITKGNGGAMSSYEKILTEEQRWNIIHYLRTFEEGNKIDLASAKKELDIKLELVEKEHKIKAIITDDGSVVSDVKVFFGVKTYFTGEYDEKVNGEKIHSVIEPLKIAIVKTDANGVATASFPTDLPGGEKGSAEIIVKFANADRSGKAVVTKTVNWAKKVHYENLTEKRAMWGTRAKSPWWILLSYLGVTIGVWLVIFYVISLMRKIKKAGKNEVS